jgi:hypothetical protein
MILSGKRMFTVLNDGLSVQHHALENNKTLGVVVGKNLNRNIDLNFKYLFQNGKELPENQSDVDSEVLAFIVKYKF